MDRESGDISPAPTTPTTEQLFLPRETLIPNPNVKLILKPGFVYPSFRDFCDETPTHSVAIDGIVIGPSEIQWKHQGGPRANIDHHEGVNRIDTPSAAGQSLFRITEGLLNEFLDGDLPRLDLNFNHVDQDTALTAFLWQYGHLQEVRSSPLFRTIVNVNDLLDRTGGFFEFTESEGLKRALLAMDPVGHYITNGTPLRPDATPTERIDSHLEIIERTHQKIIDCITGEAEDKIANYRLDTSYNVLHDLESWKMIDKMGPHGRIGMANNEISAYVWSRGVNNATGLYQYSIGGRLYGPFRDLRKIFDKLNAAEGDIVNERNAWGGSDIVGGSPRATGSSLSPEQLIPIINAAIAESS